MQKMHNSLQHASKEGRLEFLREIFKLFADFHNNLENKMIEKQENLDRAIWFYTSDLSGDGEYQEAWMKICAEDLADAQTEIADFLSILWEIKEKPSDWAQKYREELIYSESCPAETRSTLSEDGHPQTAVPSQTNKKAGRPPSAQQKTIRRMNTELNAGAITEEQLRGMAITSLADLYRVHHTVAKKARERVLLDRARGRGETFCGNSVIEFVQQKPAKKTDT